MAIFTRLPLQRRIMVLVAGGLGVALLGAGLLGRHVVAQSTARVLEERLLLARMQAAHLDERLAVAIARLEGLASAVSWELQDGVRPEAQHLLQASAARPGLFSGGFVVADTNGGTLWPATSRGVQLTDPALRAALGGTPAVSGLLRLPPEGHPAVVMLVPLRNPEGHIVGALGGIVDLHRDTLTPLISPLALGRTGHAVLVDHDGVVLAGTEEHERFTRGDHPDFFAALIQSGQAAVGRTPEIEDGMAKEMHVMAFAPLTAGQWGLGFGQSEWEVFAHEWHMQRQIILLGLGLLLLALVFGWVEARTITAPLRRLTGAAQRIADGDLQSPIPAEPGHEVGLLAGSLEAMRRSLQRVRGELQQRTDVIERQERQARALYEVSRTILRETDLSAVLAAIAAAARALLGTDVSAVCLWDRAARLVPGALDGPATAFVAADNRAPGAPLPLDGDPGLNCPFVLPQYREMHVTADLRAGGRLIGYMCVGCARPRAFREEEAGLLTALASLAAIAIQSAQLREQVQHVAVLEERERIGRDLHDSIIQSIYGISLALEHAQQSIAVGSPQAASRIDGVIDTLTRVIQDIRSYVMALHPGDGEEPLPAALERVVREFRVNTLLPVEFRARVGGEPLSGEQRLDLQLLLREALANVARHAGPCRVVVELEGDGSELQLSITDDGRGFDLSSGSRPDALGLRTMAERARRLGGRLDIRSHPGGGTAVAARVPLPVSATGVP